MLLTELLTLPAFTELHLITPEADMNRDVKNIDILDCEFIDDDLENIHSNDLVITNFSFAKSHPDVFFKCLETLLQCNISAIAIRDSFFTFTTIPAPIQQLIIDNHLPIFSFQHTHVENMVISFSNLKKSQQSYIYFETRIHQLLNYVPNPSEIKACALDINPSFKDNIICFYLIPFDNNPKDINNHFHFEEKWLKFNDYYCKYSTAHGISYLRYGRGVLILYTYYTDMQIDFISLLKDILEYAKVPNKNICVGISQSHNTFSGMLNAIHEALDASCIAQRQKKPYCIYAHSGLMCQIMTLSHDPYTKLEARRLSNRLQSYDLKYHSNLRVTINVYLKYHGDISNTAHELHMHPNTIRYRIEKVHDLLVDDIIVEDTFYEQLFLLMKIIDFI